MLELVNMVGVIVLVPMIVIILREVQQIHALLLDYKERLVRLERITNSNGG